MFITLLNRNNNIVPCRGKNCGYSKLPLVFWPGRSAVGCGMAAVVTVEKELSLT